MDPHEVLGVSPDASEDDLRAAYRDLVRRHHPDRHVHESEAYRANQARRMAEVTGAWTLLHDPDALARYRANHAREGRPPRTTSPGARPGQAPRDEGFDYRRAAAREFEDDDQLNGRWGRTPTPPPQRAADQKKRARPRPPRDRDPRTPSRSARVLNAIGWLVLLGLAVSIWLLGTDRGRDVLDDVLGAEQESSATTDAPSATSRLVSQPDAQPSGPAYPDRVFDGSDRTAGITQLAVGDCVTFELAPESAVEDLTVVACGPTPDHVVLGVSQTVLDDVTYPGRDVVTAAAADHCATVFDPLMADGTLPRSAQLRHLFPSRSSYRAGDRQVACLTSPSAPDATPPTGDATD